MNKMKEVAQLLGVELGEEFNIKDALYNPYKITNNSLVNCNGYCNAIMFLELFTGILEIEKIPYKPKNSESYWTIGKDEIKGTYRPMVDIWDDCVDDYIRYKLGLVFRTEKEAKDIGIPKLKQIINEYNNET